MAEKVTKMIMKVDLKCSRCFKKVKKVLAQIPQIRDQVYNDKNNTVTVTVVCCSPEKIQKKLCCKGDGAIKSIEIVKEAKKIDERKIVTFVDKEAPTPKPAPKPTPALAAKEVKEKLKVVSADAAPKPKPALKPTPRPAAGYPSAAAYQYGMSDTAVYVGVPGGPYYQGHGGLAAPPQYGYQAYGTPVYDSYSGGYNNPRGYCREEPPEGCSVM